MKQGHSEAEYPKDYNTVACVHFLNSVHPGPDKNWGRDKRISII